MVGAEYGKVRIDSKTGYAVTNPADVGGGSSGPTLVEYSTVFKVTTAQIDFKDWAMIDYNTNDYITFKAGRDGRIKGCAIYLLNNTLSNSNGSLVILNDKPGGSSVSYTITGGSDVRAKAPNSGTFPIEFLADDDINIEIFASVSATGDALMFIYLLVEYD